MNRPLGAFAAVVDRRIGKFVVHVEKPAARVALVFV
jgi:hypothetical protein